MKYFAGFEGKRKHYDTLDAIVLAHPDVFDVEYEYDLHEAYIQVMLHNETLHWTQPQFDIHIVNRRTVSGGRAFRLCLRYLGQEQCIGLLQTIRRADHLRGEDAELRKAVAHLAKIVKRISRRKEAEHDAD